jgi:flavodoxin
MRILMVYYSRTGNTTKVSQELAAMGADLAEVALERVGEHVNRFRRPPR